MAVVNIIIADDQKFIHEDIKKSLASLEFEFEVVADFYNTMDLNYYLMELDKRLNADVLILDHDFGGAGENGIDDLGFIRKLCPQLPILMLSGFEDDNRMFTNARKQYDIDYETKPISASKLRYAIEKVIDRMDNWEELQKQILDDKELLNLYEESNIELENKLLEAQTSLEEKTIEMNSNVDKVLPMSMRQLIQNIFPDIEFKISSFQLLVKNSIKSADWNRMFRTLKLIDWNNENSAPAGVKIQKFTQAEKYGYKNLWEYRFSQAGRVFVERRSAQRPLVVLIDPNHYYSDKNYF